MSEQSDNLNFCFFFCSYFRSVFVPRSCFFEPLFCIFYKSGVTVIEKVTETKLSALIISNVVVCIASTSGKVGSASAFLGTLGIVDISDIKQPFNYDKSISISLNGKSRDH